MSYFWTYGRNVEISVHKIKLFPNIISESSLISWGTIFNTFLFGQKFPEISMNGNEKLIRKKK